ncbi:MAG: thermonuclease family protein [Methylophilaceae bacterium]
MLSFWLALIFGGLFANICVADEDPVQAQYIVTYVYDGDTVKLHPIDKFGQQDDIKLRITEMDAPERNQSYGLKSRRALIQLCQGNHVIATTEIVAKDKYHRSLGRLRCNQVDATMVLVEQGLAWHDEKYGGDFAVEQAQVKAREQKLGLWADEAPTAPWVWRKLQRR